MTTLLQPLQCVITEGTWTGLDVAKGCIAGLPQVGLFLDEIPTVSKIASLRQLIVGAHVHVLLKRAAQLNLIQRSPWLLLGVPIFITALNGYAVYRDENPPLFPEGETLFSRISYKTYTYTPKVCAIGNAALAILEYRQNPVETVMNFTVQAIELGIKRYFSRHVANVRDSTSLVALMWLVYKGTPNEKQASIIGLAFLGYCRWKGIKRIA